MRGCESLKGGQPISAIFLTKNMTSAEVRPHNCPNRRNHTSAFPAAHRMLCPWCREVYILKIIRKEVDNGKGGFRC